MALTKSDLVAIDKNLGKRFRSLPSKEEVEEIVKNTLETKKVVVQEDLKKQLSRHPTKKEVGKIVEAVLYEKGVVTGDDLREILEANNETLKLEFREEFATKDDIKHLPTKEEFYKLVDKLP